jgi:hypothetical protein
VVSFPQLPRLGLDCQGQGPGLIEQAWGRDRAYGGECTLVQESSILGMKEPQGRKAAVLKRSQVTVSVSEHPPRLGDAPYG